MKLIQHNVFRTNTNIRGDISTPDRRNRPNRRPIVDLHNPSKAPFPSGCPTNPAPPCGSLFLLDCGCATYSFSIAFRPFIQPRVLRLGSRINDPYFGLVFNIETEFRWAVVRNSVIDRRFIEAKSRRYVVCPYNLRFRYNGCIETFRVVKTESHSYFDEILRFISNSAGFVDISPAASLSLQEFVVACFSF